MSIFQNARGVAPNGEHSGSGPVTNIEDDALLLIREAIHSNPLNPGRALLSYCKVVREKKNRTELMKI